MENLIIVKYKKRIIKRAFNGFPFDKIVEGKEVQ